MDFAQVTIALQALGLKGPLGRPVFLVSAVLDGPTQSLVCLSATVDGLVEVRRLALLPGLLDPAEADVLAVTVGDEFYKTLAVWKGVSLDLPFPAATP